MRSTALRPSLLLAVFSALGCGGPPDGRSVVRVFAAASLHPAFESLAAAFEEHHPGQRIELHVAGTPTLAMQIREGAPADVFASADDAHMERVHEAGQDSGAPVPFATNRLAIATSKGNPHAIDSLGDLDRDDLTILLCGPEVPAGRYARRALARAGASVASASDEPSVSAVVTKVALGEADAGIVYVTDGVRASERIDTIPIPAEHNVVATYPILARRAGSNAEGGAAFVELVLSPEGQLLLEQHGFSAP